MYIYQKIIIAFMSKYINLELDDENNFGLNESSTFKKVNDMIQLRTLQLTIFIFMEGLIILMFSEGFMIHFMTILPEYHSYIVVLGVYCYWFLCFSAHYLLNKFVRRKYLLIIRSAHLVMSFFSCMFMLSFLIYHQTLSPIRYIY